MALHGAEAAQVSYETDRSRFIGRGNGVTEPQALRDDRALSGSQGSVLDPIVAIRQRFALEPLQTATLDLVTGVGESRAACLHLAEKYQDRRLADRAFEMAWTHSQVALRQINVTEADAQLYGRLASSILYANACAARRGGRHRQEPARAVRACGATPSRETCRSCWCRLKDPANIELVRQLVQAHAYWRLKGLAVDLVIWNEERGGYRQLLHDQIMGLIAAGVEAQRDRPARRHLRALRRPDLERGPHPAAGGGARRLHRRPGYPRGTGQAARRGGAGHPALRRDPRPRRRTGAACCGRAARVAAVQRAAAASRPTGAST